MKPQTTAAKNFTIEPVYLPPTGNPLYWMDEQSGILKDAMTALINHHVERRLPPSPSQIEIIRAYFEYYVNAPCWVDSSGALVELRAAIREAKTLAAINRWIDAALEIGLDPL